MATCATPDLRGVLGVGDEDESGLCVLFHMVTHLPDVDGRYSGIYKQKGSDPTQKRMLGCFK